MVRLLAEKGGYLLTTETSQDFYCFYERGSISCPENQCGTAKEVRDELIRRMGEDDCQSERMQEIERYFVEKINEDEIRRGRCRIGN